MIALTAEQAQQIEEALARVEQSAEECMGDDGMVMVVPLDLYNELAESIPAIRAARAQEQEPYTPYGFCPICGRAGVSRERGLNGSDTCVTGHRYASSEAIPDTPQPVKQEPVAKVVDCDLIGNPIFGHIKRPLEIGALLYAAPVRTKDLTDDEIEAIVDSVGAHEVGCWQHVFARAVIAADREKNR